MLPPELLDLSAGVIVLLIGLLAARTGLRIVEAQRSMMLAQLKLVEAIGQLSTGFVGVDGRLDQLEIRTGAVERSLSDGRSELGQLPEKVLGPVKALLHKLNGIGHIILEGNRTLIQMKLGQTSMLAKVEQHGQQLARLIELAQSTHEDDVLTRLSEIRDMLDERLPEKVAVVVVVDNGEKLKEESGGTNAGDRGAADTGGDTDTGAAGGHSGAAGDAAPDQHEPGSAGGGAAGV